MASKAIYISQAIERIESKVGVESMPRALLLLLLLTLTAVVVLSRGVEAAAASSSSSSLHGQQQFVYQGFAGANLTLDGLATITPNGLLALTNYTYQTKAHAFHPAPLRFLLANSSSSSAAAASFSASFVFAIVSRYDGLSDHGLAFVLAPTTDFTTANAGQYLGLLNTTNGTAAHRILAVEFDTILNPEFRDINSNHVGVDVNSLVSQRARPAGYYDDGDGAFRNLSLNSREPMQVWVDYDGGSRQLNVTMAPARVPKPRRPLLSEPVDLTALVSADNSDGAMYVGFSASSGVVFTHHYVLGWSFSHGGGPAPALDLARLPALPRLWPKPRSKALEIALPLATAALVAAALAAAFFLAWRRRRFAEVREDWEDELGAGPHRFAYKDLHRATDGFRERNLLGVGGFGRVYRGAALAAAGCSESEVAVKRVSHDSRQGVREFVAEVVSIGRLRHRNLVQLLGYCRRKNELLLVYDYMPNGSLDRYLHHDDPRTPAMAWPQRYRAIKGVASGLLYLHEGWEKVVLHRDVKPSNVLLDEQMNGHLGDFGLARLYDHGTDAQTTHVVGTMGYLAPELVRTGKATPLTDVFAFGVFLLEVACGRRPIERAAAGKHGHGAGDHPVVLVDWVLERHRGGPILEAADPRLSGERRLGSAEEMEIALVLKLGLLCSHPLPEARPSMRKVVQYLEDRGQSVPADLPPPTYMSYSMMALIQNEGFDSYVMSSSSSAAASVAAVSYGSSATVLAEGR
ncbi:hypothetical protein BS78_09G019700 [Paspalum vaginatum]|nr:hypothetical protein BS78_09G019700 [Paspalum vaginatum]